MRKNACKVKICGTTTVADADMAVIAGADYSGVVVDVPFSERAVSIDAAAEISRQTSIPTVILVFDCPTDWLQHAAEAIQPFAIQLLGHETPAEVERLKEALPCEVWKSFFLPAGQTEKLNIGSSLAEIKHYTDAGADTFLFDTVKASEGKVRFGGTGMTSDWDVAATLISACKIPAFLSGGVRAENVRQAIETVCPYGIDLCSGVESTKGVRNRQKLNLLLEGVRANIENITDEPR